MNDEIVDAHANKNVTISTIILFLDGRGNRPDEISRQGKGQLNKYNGYLIIFPSNNQLDNVYLWWSQ